MEQPKILVGCPTSKHKEYCLEKYAESVKSLQVLYQKVTKYLWLLAFPVATGGIILSKEIIGLIYKEQFNNSVLALQILMLAMLFIFVNYFIGNDPEKWRTNIPTYRAVLYKEVYPGIDIKFYGSNRQMEYDIIVKPGADPSKVQLAYDGIEGLKITEKEVQFIDQIRYFRNMILYYGKSFDEVYKKVDREKVIFMAVPPLIPYCP